MAGRERGQIIKRGDQRYLLRVYRGRDPLTKKRKYQSRIFHGTRKDAEAEITRWLRGFDTGTFAGPSRITVGEHLLAWFDTKTDLRPKTRKSYDGLIRRHILPRLGSDRLDLLSPARIQEAWGEMQGEGLSPGTIRLTHSVLNSSLEQAVRWGRLGQNPARHVTLPKRRRPQLEVMTEEEVRRFLDVTKGLRYHTLWHLLFATGLRPNEALALKWEDLDEKTRRLQVRRSWTLNGTKAHRQIQHTGKTTRSNRTLDLPEATMQVLKAHRIQQAKEKLKKGGRWNDAGWMFVDRSGEAPAMRNLRTDFKRNLKKAGLKDRRLYETRHTHATLLGKKGLNVAVIRDRLGHASVSTTLQVYAQVLPEMSREAADAIGEVLAPAELEAATGS